MKLIKEIQLIFTALVFYTRLPVARLALFEEGVENRSAKYFPLVGLVIGVIAALVIIGSSLFLPQSISIALAIITSVILTGGMHEDGLADFFDGFGGGTSKPKILEIMKDSSIGTYGVLSLIFMIGMKFLVLSNIDFNLIPYLLIFAASLSRFTSVFIMYRNTYIKTSKSKSNVMVRDINFWELLLSLLIAMSPIFLLNDYMILLVIIPVLFTAWLLKQYMKKKIGGYTGDCLGAIQQISELLLLLFFIIQPWKYI